MIASLLFLTLAAPVLGDGEGETDSVLAVYDVESLDPGASDAYQTWASLLPYVDPRVRRYESNEYDDDHWEADEGFDVDPIANLVTLLYPEEFEFEGRSMSIGDSGRVAVRGPEALHARVRRLLDFLEETLHAEVEVTVDVLRLPAGAMVPVDGVLADEATVAGLLADAGGRRQSFQVALRADRATTVDHSSDRSMVFGYGSEVAEAIAVHEPAVGSVSIGTRLSLRAAPTPGGLMLAIQLVRGELVEEPGLQPIDLHILLGLEQGLRHEQGARLVETLRVLNRSLALDTFLPDGRALVLHSAVDGEAASAREVIVVRRTGGALPLLSRLQLDDGGFELAVANLALVRPPRTVARGQLLAPDFVSTDIIVRWLMTESVSTRPLAVQILGDDLEYARQWLIDGLEGMSARDYRAWTFLFPKGRSSSGRENVLQSQARIEETLAALSADTRMVDLTVALRRSAAAEGAPIARARLPLRSGESCTLTLGVEGTELGSYQVEIAGRSTIAAPEMHTRFDGLVLWLRPTLGAGGDLDLELRGGGHVRTGGPTELELGGLVAPKVQRSTFDHVFVNQRLRFEAEEAEWRAVLGDAAGGAAGALQLEIVARRVE